MPYRDENSYPSVLVLLCATVRNVSNEDEQGWKTVKGRKETNAPIETQIRMKEVNSGGGTRFDALEVTMNSEEDFPVLMADVQNGAAKQTRTILWRCPREVLKLRPSKKIAHMVKWPGLAALSRRSPRSGPRVRGRRFHVVDSIAILYWELWPTTMTTNSSPSGPRRSGRSV